MCPHILNTLIDLLWEGFLAPAMQVVHQLYSGRIYWSTTKRLAVPKIPDRPTSRSGFPTFHAILFVV